MDGVADAYTLADGLLTMADENMELVFARAAGNPTDLLYVVVDPRISLTGKSR